jgi:hypothetical protein
MAAMDGFDRERIYADLPEVEACLRDQVPKATGLELDRIKLRAMNAHASPGRSTRRGEFMRSRIAVTMMLVIGFLISGTGAGLAVSGISGAGSAAEHEYPTEAADGQQGIAGEQAGGNQASQGGGNQASQGGGNQASQGGGNQASQGVEAAQAARQVAVSGGGNGLPFTGLAAIPLLLVGVGLTASGFVFRRAGARD